MLMLLWLLSASGASGGTSALSSPLSWLEVASFNKICLNGAWNSSAQHGKHITSKAADYAGQGRDPKHK
jgi:hypothetical protein